MCHLYKTIDNKQNDEDEVSRVTCKKQETTKKTKRMKKRNRCRQGGQGPSFQAAQSCGDRGPSFQAAQSCGDRGPSLCQVDEPAFLSIAQIMLGPIVELNNVEML